MFRNELGMLTIAHLMPMKNKRWNRGDLQSLPQDGCPRKKKGAANSNVVLALFF
jgi:hypothetical protein